MNGLVIILISELVVWKICLSVQLLPIGKELSVSEWSVDLVRVKNNYIWKFLNVIADDLHTSIVFG